MSVWASSFRWTNAEPAGGVTHTLTADPSNRVIVAPSNGSATVCRIPSFGEGIQMTPLQLGALASTIANGGTLYYLQYPRTAETKETFEPRIKRTFEFDSQLGDVREGMLAAVLHGTARRSYISDDE